MGFVGAEGKKLGFWGTKDTQCAFMAAFLLPESLMIQSVDVGGHHQTQALVYTSQVLCSSAAFLVLGFFDKVLLCSPGLPGYKDFP